MNIVAMRLFTMKKREDVNRKLLSKYLITAYLILV